MLEYIVVTLYKMHHIVLVFSYDGSIGSTTAKTSSISILRTIQGILKRYLFYIPKEVYNFILNQERNNPIYKIKYLDSLTCLKLVLNFFKNLNRSEIMVLF